ncbi:hypothetical protein DVH26_09940 [Paenibacillus sp. H1-7]|nr:hypothetical protein DVH26_09940 [Paenibacillus sp. H1-7]
MCQAIACCGCITAPVRRSRGSEDEQHRFGSGAHRAVRAACGGCRAMLAYPHPR